MMAPNAAARRWVSVETMLRTNPRPTLPRTRTEKARACRNATLRGMVPHSATNGDWASERNAESWIAS